MMSKHVTTLLSTLNNIDKHGMATLVACSEIGDRLTKKSRADKSPRPEFLEGLKRYTMSVVSLHHDYTRAVENQIVKGGGDKSQWETEESKISEPFAQSTNGIMRQGLRNPEQKYVRVFVGLGANKSYEEVYINAKGENVTELITKEVKENYFPKKYASKKQEAVGVAKEVKPREYKAENIFYLQKGDKVFNVLSSDLMNLFGLELV
jgi:hypothetical protein